jgi:hypothetical protein
MTAAQLASAAPLLQRLQGIQKSGDGWRAYCPSCDGSSRKLSIAQVDSRVLLHCFGGCRAEDVLSSTGLSWADLMPPRHWPPSPEERRSVRRAIRAAGWAAALSTLALEASVVLLAARQLAGWQSISEADDARLALSVERLDGAANVLLETRTWRPAA